MTIVVVEFFNYKTLQSCTMNGGVFMVSGSKLFEDVCADMDSNPNQTKSEREHQMHAYVIRDRNFSIKIDFQNFFGTIKITATSGKFLGTYGNCTSNEIVCILDGQVFCIDKLLECDGNFNCGTPKLYDEYCSNLYVQENILLMIIYGVCLVAVMMFFLIQLLRVCVPSVADHFFVFHESDEYKFVLTSQSLPPLEPY
ncbi:uncharacterized protein LOC123013760 isoform X2 [Tribolium madens]|nr:uncharacterized protein LOC123013760 isoform X2 [Tribolium madens]